MIAITLAILTGKGGIFTIFYLKLLSFLPKRHIFEGSACRSRADYAVELVFYPSNLDVNLAMVDEFSWDTLWEICLGG